MSDERVQRQTSAITHTVTLIRSQPFHCVGHSVWSGGIRSATHSQEPSPRSPSLFIAARASGGLRSAECGVQSTVPSDPAASSSSRRRLPLLLGHMAGQSPRAVARPRGCLVDCPTPPDSALRCLSSHWFLWPPPWTSPALQLHSSLPQLHLATRPVPCIINKEKKRSAK